jgi:hypothetical protein
MTQSLLNGLLILQCLKVLIIVDDYQSVRANLWSQLKIKIEGLVVNMTQNNIIFPILCIIHLTHSNIFFCPKKTNIFRAIQVDNCTQTQMLHL